MDGSFRSAEQALEAALVRERNQNQQLKEGVKTLDRRLRRASWISGIAAAIATLACVGLFFSSRVIASLRLKLEQADQSLTLMEEKLVQAERRVQQVEASARQAQQSLDKVKKELEAARKKPKK